jgi:hypothetical protein
LNKRGCCSAAAGWQGCEKAIFDKEFILTRPNQAESNFLWTLVLTVFIASAIKISNNIHVSI